MFKNIMETLLFFLFLYLTTITPVNAASSLSGVPSIVEPCNGGLGLNLSNDPKSCSPSDVTYTQLYYKGPKIGNGGGIFNYAVGAIYLPFSGMWYLQLNACASTEMALCTVAKTTQSFPTKALQLTSGSLVVDQNPDFGGALPAQLAADSNLCMVFVSSDGTQWKAPQDAFPQRWCQDAYTLPATPSFCYLNMGSDLNIDLGIVERGMISTAVGTSTKKVIPLKVMCAGDANLTATFSLKYTPLTVVGSEVVSTSTAGVGVAVFLNDKLMTTTEQATMDFNPGIQTVDLGLEIVRDPYVNIGTVKTGEFTADAVMVLTKQ